MNHKVKWLIEPDVFTDNTDKIYDLLIADGATVRKIPYVPFDDHLVERCEEIYGIGECVVFYGSLNFGRKLMACQWTPGVYLKKREYECTSYYPFIGENLLHEHYMMLPYGELIRKRDFIFDTFGGYGPRKVFIRPNSGMKEFTGMICPEYNFEECVKLAGFYDVDPDLLCLISSVKNIKKEWRFVIVGGKVIAGSLYRDWSHGEKQSRNVSTKDYVLMNSHSLWEGCDDKLAWDAAQRGANKYNPDHAWTIDVALISGYQNYKVIEIGCFSCAGMYGNDLGLIVDAVSEAAVKDWEEIWGKEEDK
jgi:hypothetical protein